MNPTREIPFAELDPFVRYVQRFIVSEAAYLSDVCAYDCRLFYICQGSGTLRYEGQTHRISCGDLMVFMPGKRYRMTSTAGDPLIFLGCNFDCTQTENSITIPVPPAREEDFTGQIIDPVLFTDTPAMNDLIFLHNMYSAENVLVDMHNEYGAQKIYCQKRLGALLQSILCIAARNVSNAGTSLLSISPAKMNEIIAYIQDHHAENLTNQSIGSHFSYHPNYLSRQFVSYTGKSLYQYLLSCRISRAIDLLCTTDKPIADIAVTVGFANASHFCKTFRQKTGVAPGAMRYPEYTTFVPVKRSTATVFSEKNL